MSLLGENNIQRLPAAILFEYSFFFSCLHVTDNYLIRLLELVTFFESMVQRSSGGEGNSEGENRWGAKQRVDEREEEMTGYKRSEWGWSARGGDVEWTISKTSPCLLLGCTRTSTSSTVWFPLPGLPGYSEVQHVPGKASGTSWNIYPRCEETWGKLHGKLKGPNKEGGWGTARMTNIVTKQNFFKRKWGLVWAMKLLHRCSQ